MGIFIDIFPADRYHTDPRQFKNEKLKKNYFYYLCKALDAELDKQHSVKKRIVSYFKPLFRLLAKHYLRMANRYIDDNRSLGDHCYIGHGFDTPWRRYFSYDEIFPLKEYIFEEHVFLGPNDANAYLTQLYGANYMTPPPMEKREQKHAAILKPIIN